MRRVGEAEGVYRFPGIGGSDEPWEAAARSAVRTMQGPYRTPTSSRCPAPSSDREAAGDATLVGDGSAPIQDPPRRHASFRTVETTTELVDELAPLMKSGSASPGRASGLGPVGQLSPYGARRKRARI